MLSGHKADSPLMLLTTMLLRIPGIGLPAARWTISSRYTYHLFSWGHREILSARHGTKEPPPYRTDIMIYCVSFFTQNYYFLNFFYLF
jgi:hypothetical protein